MNDSEQVFELERWARVRAATAPTHIAQELPTRLEGLSFRERGKVLDAALVALSTSSLPKESSLAVLRALERAMDADALRATLEALAPSTLAPIIAWLSEGRDALFALALAAWPGPLSWVSVARTHAAWPGDDAAREALVAVLDDGARASSRVRAMNELVALGPHPASTAAITRAVDDTVHDLRTAAVRALARMAATAPLLSALESLHATVRSDARQLLAELVRRREVDRDSVIDAMTTLSRHPSQSPRDQLELRRTLRSLGERVDPAPWSGLHEDAAQNLLHEVDTLANRVAISEYVETLADTDDPRAFAAVREALSKPAKVSRSLAGFRPFFRGPLGARALRVLASDVDPLVRERAAELSRMLV
jgi:hypothetical protein